MKVKDERYGMVGSYPIATLDVAAVVIRSHAA